MTGAPFTCGKSRAASSRNSTSLAPLRLDQIPFVDADDERPALALDEIGQA